MEAKITWDICKSFEFKVSNELAMIEAIAKVKDCQDFSLPKKRGRPKKNKGCSKHRQFAFATSCFGVF